MSEYFECAIYTQEKGLHERPLNSDLIEYDESSDDFHLEKYRGKDTVSKILCKECRTDKMQVAQANYRTLIKCSNCKWEICIHEG